jgi:hypothetical protein
MYTIYCELENENAGIEDSKHFELLSTPMH